MKIKMHPLKDRILTKLRCFFDICIVFLTVCVASFVFCLCFNVNPSDGFFQLEAVLAIQFHMVTPLFSNGLVSLLALAKHLLECFSSGASNLTNSL